MKPIEIMFFAVAFLLPLVGGGALLYFLAKPKRATSEPEETNDRKETKGK